MTATSRKLRQILLDIAKAHPRLMQSPAPAALITGFAENAINFELSGVVRNIGDGGRVKSDLILPFCSAFAPREY